MPAPALSPSTDRPPLLARAAVPLLLLCAIVALGRLCAHDFTWWDDQGTVHHNPWLNPPTFKTLFHYWTTPAYGLYIPVTYTLWTAIAAVAPVQPDVYGIALNPWLFHTANVAVHLLSVLAVYRILRLLNADEFASFCGALLFAVHPIQVEPVGWVSGMKDVLCGMLSLVALWQYVAFARSDLDGLDHRPATGSFVLATAAFILALLAKPSAITLPLIAAAMDRWAVGRPWRRVLSGAIPWLILAIPAAVIARVVQPATGVPPAPVWARPFIIGDALAFYLYKLAIPIRLGVDYGRTPAKVLAQGWCYWEWTIPAALAACLITGARRRPVLLAAGAVFLAGSLPTLGWTTFLFQYYSTTADHYLYVSMLGPALAVAWLLSVRPDPLYRWTSSIALFVLVILSIRQSGFWSDDFALFNHAADVNPDSFLAYNNLGTVYQLENQLDQSAVAFRQAERIKPDFFRAHSNLADILGSLGQLDEAIAETKISMQLQSDLPLELRATWIQDHERLGQLLAAKGEVTEAIPYLEKAVELKPDDAGFAEQLRAARERAATQPVREVK